ncbi:MAG: TIGR00296 family protein [Candidatus Heimdallarchaeota archaeon]|nr:TIGR00296 family protein [Candidatus Heimdallarchaeota archaeon]MCK4954812.1 TIGR00296 family protein [Candidatus Heimdallarchaeota archaeon]
MKIEDETGYYLVKLARKAAESWITKEEKPEPIENIPKQALMKTGAFVTVKKKTGDQFTLRGCIGYVLGINSLNEEIIALARESTQNDPRFPPVSRDELSEIIFEVTVLTPPEEIKYETPQELLDQINIPGDGLIVKFGRFQGLLLPQVPIEQGWNEEEFISYTCRKAYLSVDIWKKEKITVEKFQGIVFGEKEPNGLIERSEFSC